MAWLTLNEKYNEKFKNPESLTTRDILALLKWEHLQYLRITCPSWGIMIKHSDATPKEVLREIQTALKDIAHYNSELGMFIIELQHRRCHFCGTTERLLENHIMYEPEITEVLCQRCHGQYHSHLQEGLKIGYYVVTGRILKKREHPDWNDEKIDLELRKVKY